MTDKQIIIDEIDVTSCIYACRKLNKDGLHDCRIPNTAPFCCENIRNCYYKQLKRKEQECEELKEEIKKHNDDMFKNPPEKRFYCKGCTLPYISKKLKTENDNLKETFDDLFKVQYQLADNNKKLRQCLTEIKEIAKVLITTTDEYDSCYYKDRCSKCEVKEDCQYFKVEQILQKISEVKNE